MTDTTTRPPELRACLRASIEGPTPDEAKRAEWYGGTTTIADPPNRWTITLQHETAALPWTFTYWTGPGMDPVTVTRAQALASVLLDCGSIEDETTFEDWADEFGYDTDSRKAEATYNAVRDQRAQLAGVLGITPAELTALVADNANADDDPDHEALAAWLIGS